MPDTGPSSQGPSSLVYTPCENPKICPGHLGHCTHVTGLIACRPCIEERERVGVIWCDKPATKGSQGRGAVSPSNPEASRPKPSTLPVGPSGVSKKGS